MKPRKAKRKTSSDMCPCCYWANCDPIHGFTETPYVRKRNYRLQNNLCVACGKNPCGCKRRDRKSNIE